MKTKIHHILFCALAFCIMSCGRSDSTLSHPTKQKEYFVNAEGGKVSIPAFAYNYEDVTIRTGCLSSLMNSIKGGHPNESWINVRAMTLGYSKARKGCIPNATLFVNPNNTARNRKATVTFHRSSSEKETFTVIQYGKSE